MFQDNIAIDIETVPAEGPCGKLLEIAKEKTRSDGKLGMPGDSRDFSGVI